MKKLLALISAVVIVLVGCGQSTPSPTEVVETYFSELKKGESGDFEKLLEDSLGDTASQATEMSKEEKEALKSMTSKLEVKVLSEKIDGDKATVNATVTGIEFGTIIMEIFSETLTQAFAGNELTEEEMDAKLIEKMKTAKPTDRTGDIHLVKKEEKWVIKSDDELSSLIVGIDEDAFEGFEEQNSGEESNATLPFDVVIKDDYKIRASEYEEGKDIFVVNVTFTNKSEESQSADSMMMIQAFDEDTGIEMEEAFDGAVASDNYSKSLRPGATVEFEVGFYIQKGKKPSKVTLEGTEVFSFNNAKVTKEIIVK